MSPSEKTLLIGLGHPYRSDDAFGPRAIEALREKFGDRFEYQKHSGDPADLLDSWDRRTIVILDVLRTPDPKPGTIHCLKVEEGLVLPGAPSVSSHALSLGEALEMGRILHKMPKRGLILGVEGENFNPGDQLSPAVASALEEVVTLVPNIMEGV